MTQRSYQCPGGTKTTEAGNQTRASSPGRIQSLERARLPPGRLIRCRVAFGHPIEASSVTSPTDRHPRLIPILPPLTPLPPCFRGFGFGVPITTPGRGGNRTRVRCSRAAVDRQITRLSPPTPGSETVSLKTNHLSEIGPWATQRFPLGHPRFSTGPPKVFHRVAQASVYYLANTTLVATDQQRVAKTTDARTTTRWSVWRCKQLLVGPERKVGW